MVGPSGSADLTDDLTPACASVRRLPVPARDDRCHGPLIPALPSVVELLAERGIRVDHVTAYRRVQRYTAEFIEAARPARRLPVGRWFIDETYVQVAGRWTYLYRAIDQHGQVIDVMLSVRRDLAAARHFFTRALAVRVLPVEVTTDPAPA